MDKDHDNDSYIHPICEFRGVISNGKNNYFIINELFSSENNKIFTATQISFLKNQRIDVTGGEPLTIRYVSKKYIQNCIFKDLNVSEERVEKLYQSLKKSFNKFQNIKHPNLQGLYDFIEDKNGLYFVMEFCENTLFDFVRTTREPLKNSKYPIELKFRKIIADMLSCIQYVHECGLYFGALINPQEIYVKEGSRGHGIGSNANLVKLPHPFLAHLFTLLALKSKPESFPSFFAPEIYTGFVEKIYHKKQNLFEGFTSMLNDIDQNFDIWAFGFWVYEMLFDELPFKFESIEDANSKFSLGTDLTYQIFPWRISFEMLQLITGCLKLDPKKRIQNIDLNKLLKEINLQNEMGDVIEKELKERNEKMNKKKDGISLNIIDDPQIEIYGKKNIS